MTKAVVLVAGAPNPAMTLMKETLNGYEEIYYVGVDRGAMHLMEAKLPIQLAIGDFDSVSEQDLARIRDYAEDVRIYPSAKDDTDMELALAHLVDYLEHDDQVPIYIFGGLGSSANGRMDHWLSVLMVAYQPRFSPIISQLFFIEKSWRGTILTAGIHLLPPNKTAKYLSVLSLTPVKQLAISGSLYELKPTDFSVPRALISNEYMDEEVIISFDDGLVFVMEILSEGENK